MAEMYLYNGVELPKIPDTPSYSNYDYSRHVLADLGNSYCIYYAGGGTPRYSENGLFFSGYDFVAYIYKDVAGAVWSSPSLILGTGVTVSLSKIIWSNYDITDGDGNVIFEASVPVVPPLIDMTSINAPALVQGWIVGKRLAGMRGRQIAAETSVLGAAVLGTMILGGE